MLVSLGWYVVEASYEKANVVDKTRQQPVNIVILDDVNSSSQLDFCRWLKTSEEMKNIPVVVVIVADVLEVPQNIAFAAGADLYFHAPINLDEFTVAIKNV